MESNINHSHISVYSKDLSEKLSDLEGKYNKQFKDIFEAINYLLQNDKNKIEQNERSNIGYKT